MGDDGHERLIGQMLAVCRMFLAAVVPVASVWTRLLQPLRALHDLLRDLILGTHVASSLFARTRCADKEIYTAVFARRITGRLLNEGVASIKSQIRVAECQIRGGRNAASRSQHPREPSNGLDWENPVAERRVSLVVGQEVGGVGDPARREAHEPFHESWRRPWAFLLVQDRRCGGCSSGDVFPSGDGVGVSPPAVKMSSISANSVSGAFQLVGEPAGP